MSVFYPPIKYQRKKYESEPFMHTQDIYDNFGEEEDVSVRGKIRSFEKKMLNLHHKVNLNEEHIKYLEETLEEMRIHGIPTKSTEAEIAEIDMMKARKVSMICEVHEHLTALLKRKS
jgi:hypothetical protein